MPFTFRLLSSCSVFHASPPTLQVLSKYGALWQHMFRLRRVQLALEGAWATLQVHPLACLPAPASCQPASQPACRRAANLASCLLLCCVTKRVV